MTHAIKSMTTRGQRGFTLIELLVVIAIIGILAALILAALNSAQKGARDSERKSDLNQYKTALAQYKADNATYPVQAAATAMTNANAPYSSLNPNYISAFLDDPTNGASYYYIGSATQFGVCANLERKSGSRFEVGPTISQETSGAASSCALLN
ncbi:MAG: prepilin-type N-terminal cleavage/methylation domain-containing protein [Patescibacteria group bacterium]